MNAVVGAILENLNQIEIVFKTTNEAFVYDTKHTADSKELTVAQFLQSFFPSSYSVKKGPIYGKETNSQEIDCVILAPNHPHLYTPKRKVIIAEGVYAAIEVKPNIATLTEKSEFHRALIQIQSVKRIKRELPVLFTEGIVLDDMKKIPSVIFSKKSRNAEVTIEYMKKTVNNNILLANELPDMIVTLDNGIIFHTTCIQNTLFNNWVKQQSEIHTGEKYIHLQTSRENTLGFFLLILLCFKGPEPTISDFIIKDYLLSGLNSVNFNVFEP